MALKAEVASLDEIDEPHRDLYVQKNGKFVLDVDADPGAALKTALQKERQRAGAYEKRLKTLGIDEREDDEVSELLSLGEQAKQGKGRADDQVEQVKAALTKTHQRELDKRDTMIAELTTTLEEQLRDNAARTALEEHKGDVELLLPHVQGKVTVVRGDDGKYVARVKGEKSGEFRLNDKGDPMSVAELVAEMRGDKKFGLAFEGAGGSGSDAKPDAPPIETGRLPGAKTERQSRLVAQKRRMGAGAI